MAVALEQGRGENWIIQETLKQLQVKHCIKISVMNWDLLEMYFGLLLYIHFAGYKQTGFWESVEEEAREIGRNMKEKEIWPLPWGGELWRKR